MDFEEKMKSFVGRVESLKNNVLTEEATKTSIIMPFFQLLDYDVFNPTEFMPEYVADVGIKKGEKVDYAIFINGELTILIEAKSVTERLEKHDSQLFRYFGTSSAKFAILTNGLEYKFYTDLDEPNKMDSTPFLEVSLSELKDADIQELKKFQKENFDINAILDTASELKYLGQIKRVLKEEFANPSDEFVKYILSRDIYDGIKTQSVIDKYKPIIKRSIAQYVNDSVNEKIKTALKDDGNELAAETLSDVGEEAPEADGVNTTEEEIQSYYIIKSILAPYIEMERITYKDTMSYFGILLDGKVTKWICRIFLKENTSFVIIANGEKEGVKYYIDSINDLYKLSDHLVERLSALL